MAKTAKKRLWWTLGIILLILIALRIALEPIALHYVNKALANLEGYKGDIEISDLYGTAINLSTVLDEDKKLPSRIEATANTSGNGGLTLEMDLNMLKVIPDFDLDLSTEHVELPFLNDFTEAYANFTFKDGTVDIFSEIAMDDGQYKGYVKPILKDVKVIDLDNKSTTFWRKAWEVVVGTTMKIFQNQKEEQFATEVPFSGNMTGSDVGILATIGNVLKNAFVEAFDAQIDDKVDINSIKEKDEKKGLFDFLKKTRINKD